MKLKIQNESERERFRVNVQIHLTFPNIGICVLWPMGQSIGV